MMYQYNNRCVSKKRAGFTLVELIVVVVIIVIAIALAASSNLFGLNTFSRSQERSQHQFEVRMATDFIVKHLRYADAIASSDGTIDPDYKNYIFLSSGAIVCYEDGAEIKIPGAETVDDFTFNISSIDKNITFTVGKTDTDGAYDVVTSIDVLNLESKTDINSNGIKYNLDAAGMVDITNFTTSP